jgi:putative molybdopterin biosynthesis protein
MEVMSAKELSRYLKINEKKIYKLVQESRIPSLKIGGKIAFTREIIDRWILENTERGEQILLAGSDDMLLRRIIDLYNGSAQSTVFYAPVGSMNGLALLKKGAATASPVHILDTQSKDYSLSYVSRHLGDGHFTVTHLFLREQGIYLPKGNPKGIRRLEDIPAKAVTVVNRNRGSGTRLLIDYLFHTLRIDPATVKGYDSEVASHLETGLQVLTGKVDAGFGIKYVAHLLGLDFVPQFTERFDLVVPEEHYHSDPVKRLLGWFSQPQLLHHIGDFTGYDTSRMGSLIYP